MNNGYVKIYRQVTENRLFSRREKYCRLMAWIDLIMLANYSDTFIFVRGIKVELKRGQLGWSEVQLAKRWKWNRETVRRFLTDLVNERMIEKLTKKVCHFSAANCVTDSIQETIQQKKSATTIISIVNYDDYQSNHTAKRTTEHTTDHTTEHTQIIKKNKKEESIFPAFWKKYKCRPNRKGNKKKAEALFDSLSPEDQQRAVQALDVLQNSPDWKEKDGQYIPGVLPYLNQRLWDGVDGDNSLPLFGQPEIQVCKVCGGRGCDQCGGRGKVRTHAIGS